MRRAFQSIIKPAVVVGGVTGYSGYNYNKSVTILEEAKKEEAAEDVASIPAFKQKVKYSEHPCTQQGKFVKGPPTTHHTGCNELKIFSGRSHPALAKEVGNILGVSPAKAIVSSFADGETNIQVQESVRGLDVYIIQSCITPVNDRVIELLLLVSTMHRASAKRVTAVIPFMGYKHHKRVGAVSPDKTTRFLGSAAQDFARMLEVLGVDRVIAVDLQRPGHQSEGTFFNVPVETCMTDTLGIEHFAKTPNLLTSEQIVVVSPNPDTVKKAQIFRHGLLDHFRETHKVSFAMFSRASVAEGTRLHHESELLGSVDGADVVIVSFAMFSRAPVVDGTRLHHESELLGSVDGADVVIVDDIIDTANTLIRAAQVCRQNGAKNIYVLASHGLFTRDALRKIEDTPEITGVVVNNTIPLPQWYVGNKVSQLSVAHLLAKRIEQDHFRRHLYNEEEYVPDPTAST